MNGLRPTQQTTHALNVFALHLQHPNEISWEIIFNNQWTARNGRKNLPRDYRISDEID